MCFLFAVSLTPCIAASYEKEDYAFMWWPYGFRGLSDHGEQVLCIQTGRYGMSFNIDKAVIMNIGKITNTLPYEDAVARNGNDIFNLPVPKFRISVDAGDKHYEAVRSAVNKSALSYPVRMIDSGRFVQRFDVLQLEFANKKNEFLDADSRIEFIAWPDRLTIICEIIPKSDLADASISINLDGQTAKSKRSLIRAGEKSLVSLAWAPDSVTIINEYRNSVQVSENASNESKLPVKYDPVGGFYKISMPTASWQTWLDPDRLDRYKVKLNNPTDKEQVFRLLFSYDDAADGTLPILPGIVGMSPMLRDKEGNPSGIPVQISKNWHRQPDLDLPYQGPWFHGYTMIHLPPRSEWQGEYNMAYARWGGIPAVSHSQLCLIGYAMNQIWDEMAIGSWGESICYDPDVNLQRSMIDDIRPLMVSTDGKPLWTFTNNVGGGDFLVYFNEKNNKQFLSGVRTAYLQYGPNLTHVIYAGKSADGSISARISASSPRCDDINRAYYHLRYDVTKPAKFTRLAFFQLGSDNYSDVIYKKIARGNLDNGLEEEWVTERGGLKYLRTGIACDGTTPWFSLHESEYNPAKGMENNGFANRGLIIRSWKARLGGKEIPIPYASIYGANSSVPTAILELSPPPELTELIPGDYLEADIEMVIVPVSALEYFGPNENLRKDLQKNADTWRPV